MGDQELNTTSGGLPAEVFGVEVAGWPTQPDDNEDPLKETRKIQNRGRMPRRHPGETGVKLENLHKPGKTRRTLVSQDRGLS